MAEHNKTPMQENICFKLPKMSKNTGVEKAYILLICRLHFLAFCRLIHTLSEVYWDCTELLNFQAIIGNLSLYKLF